MQASSRSYQIADFAIRGNYSYLPQHVKIGSNRASADIDMAYGAGRGGDSRV